MAFDIRSALPTLSRRIRQNFADSIAIDTRTLAVFRVFVGLLIIADVISRSRNFWFYYTDDGVVPQSLAMDVTPDYAVSFFFLSTDPTVIAALFVLKVLFALQLIIGYKTRIATIISFLFVISMDFHNPFVTSYADTLFRLLMFWAIFLPLGERWSVDAVHRTREPRTRIVSVASALILSQMVYMYIVNGYHKSSDELWTGGGATPKIMGIDEMTFFLGPYVVEFQTLLLYGGLLWYYMLLFAWLLILLVGWPRMVMVGLFMGGHAMFAVTVRIGAFPYVALAGLLLFVQTHFWEDMKALLGYFNVDISPLVSRLYALERVADYFPDYRLTGERQAVLRAQLYNVAIGAIVITIVLFAIGPYVSLGGVADDDAPHKQQIEDVADSLNIDQPEWSVFAPTPRTTDRYYVFAAQTADGEQIDVYNERMLTFERPDEPLQTQHDAYRERFYMNSIRRGSSNHERNQLLADYHCTKWEDEYDIELTHINFYFVSETITLETASDPTDRDSRHSLISKHACGDHEPKDFASSSL